MVLAVLFAFGSILGSFLNVLIYRIPRGRSVVTPPSSCPVCGERIRPWDNIPVLSYLLLRGRCRHCSTRISPRYPLVELLAAAIPVLFYMKLGFGAEFVVYSALTYALLVISFIDLDFRVIPNKVTLPGLVIGLIAAPLLGVTSLLDSLIGALVGGGGLYLIAVLGALAFKQESMGGGDIKLAAMLGAFMGWKAVLLLLFTAFLVGSVVGGVMMARKGHGADHQIPFGPFISLGAIIAMTWGDVIIAWYAMRLA